MYSTLLPTGSRLLGSGIDSPAVSLAVSGNDLYAGGFFTMAGGVPANKIAKWNGSAWSALGSPSGANEVVRTLAWQGANLYAGGVFTVLGGTISHYFGRFGCPLITLTPATLPSGAVGGNYNQALTANPSGTYTLSITGTTCASFDFTSETTPPLALGIQPFEVATGDFNKDGQSDLAITTINQTNLRVLLGSG